MWQHNPPSEHSMLEKKPPFTRWYNFQRDTMLHASPISIDCQWTPCRSDVRCSAEGSGQMRITDAANWHWPMVDSYSEHALLINLHPPLWHTLDWMQPAEFRLIPKLIQHWAGAIAFLSRSILGSAESKLPDILWSAFRSTITPGFQFILPTTTYDKCCRKPPS